MSCDDVRAEYLAGDEGIFEDHAQGCAECRAQRSELRAAREALDETAVWSEPPADMAERVVGAVAQSVEVPPRRRRIIPILAGAAAVLVVAIGLASLFLRSGPDWEIRVEATDSAAQLNGIIAGWNEPEGTRVVLDLDGLEPVPGFMYELWFSSETVAVSAGTFIRGNDVELTVGVARADFPRVWITREPLDGDPLPEGELVYDVMTTG